MAVELAKAGKRAYSHSETGSGISGQTIKPSGEEQLAKIFSAGRLLVGGMKIIQWFFDQLKHKFTKTGTIFVVINGGWWKMYLVVLFFSLLAQAESLDFQDFSLESTETTAVAEPERPPTYVAPSPPVIQQPATQLQPGQAFAQSQCPGVTTVECDVLKLTNNYRRRNGLPALIMSKKCNQAARLANNYNLSIRNLTHNWFQQNGSQWRLRAENVAMGQQSAAEVVNGWINSPGHRRNLLLRDVRYMGISLVRGPGRGNIPGYYWAQCFH